MNNKITFPQATITELVSHYTNGVSINKLTKLYSIGEKPLTRILVNAGVHSVTARCFQRLEGKLDEIYSKYTKGISKKALADEYGVTQHTIDLFFKINQLKCRITNSNLGDNEIKIVNDYKAGISISTLTKNYQVGFETIHNLLDKHGISLRTLSESQRSYKLNENALDSIDNEEKAYFLGFMYADGYNAEGIGKSPRRGFKISLHKKDIEILERFKQMIGSNHPLYTCNDGRGVTLDIRSALLSERLSELGCHQAKSFTLTFPEWLSDTLMPHFLRGYVDGDGCIHIKGKCVTFSAVGSVAFINKFAEIINRVCQVRVVIRQINNNQSKILVVAVRGRLQVKKVVDYLYSDSTIHLERKKMLANSIINSPNIVGRKMNSDQIAVIKSRINNNDSLRTIASDFGLDYSTICKIKNNKLWSNL